MDKISASCLYMQHREAYLDVHAGYSYSDLESFNNAIPCLPLSAVPHQVNMVRSEQLQSMRVVKMGEKKAASAEGRWRSLRCRLPALYVQQFNSAHGSLLLHKQNFLQTRSKLHVHESRPPIRQVVYRSLACFYNTVHTVLTAMS